MSKIPELVAVDHIQSFADVSRTLTELKGTHAQNAAPQFAIFNNAYLIVTSNIEQAARTHKFDDSKFIERFTVNFAHYYFRSLNASLQHTHQVDAWIALDTAGQRKNTPHFILLLLGANAHINHDLPLVLEELMKHETSDDSLRDLIKIDSILMSSGKDIIRLFDEPNKVLHFIKRHFSFMYYQPTMYMIRFWRIRAWTRYRAIKRKGLRDSNYARGSAIIARRLLFLGKCMG